MNSDFKIDQSIAYKIQRDVPEVVNDFNQEMLRQQRNKLIIELFNNPETFAKTLFTKEKKGIIKRRSKLYSTILRLNDPQFCCLVRMLQNDDPKVCYFAQIQEEQGGYKIEVGIPKGVLQGNRITAGAKGLSAGQIAALGAGKTESNVYFVRVYKNFNPDINFSVVAPGRIRANKIEIYKDCNNKYVLDAKQYIGSDKFTNSILIGYLLNLIYEPNPPNNNSLNMYGLDGITRTYAATTCLNGSNEKGLLFTQYSSLGSLNNLLTELYGIKYFEKAELPDGQQIIKANYKFTVDLLKQLLANLHFLTYNYFFNHGGLIASDINIDEKVADIDYLNVKVKSNFTARIDNFEHAAITVAKDQNTIIRLYNRSYVGEKLFYVAPFSPNVAKQLGEEYYTLGGKFNASSLTEIRHMGIPYYSSFDAYTLLISIMIIPEFFYTIFSDTNLENLFNTLFFREDRSTVYAGIYQAVMGKRPNNYDTVLTILRGKKLKCNMLTDVLKLLVNL